MKKTVCFLLLILLSGFLFFSALDKASLWDIDEPNNAECAREMMIRHDPIVPTFNGELRTDKPALIYWCMWSAYKIFGVNEFSARFFSPLFGVATVILVFLAGNSLFLWPTGLWAGLILLSTLFFNISVRIATPDAALIFFINLAIFSFILGYETRRGVYFYLFFLAMALAVLAKGPMGIVLPLTTIFVFLVIKRDFSVLKETRLAKGLLLFFLVALPWYVLVGIKTHGAFLVGKEGFLLKHNIHRFLNPMEGHKAPFFFYIVILPFIFFPWGGLLPHLLWTGHKHRVKRALSNPEMFLWLWITIFILFFSLARTKLPTYINPIFPALAVLTAFYLKEMPVWVTKCFLHFNGFFALLLLFGGGAALAQFYPRLGWIAFLGFIPLISWQIGLYFSRQRQHARLVLSQFLGAYLFILALVNWAVPAIDQYKITKSFALQIKQQLKKDAAIIAYHYFQPSLVFYTQHKVEKINDPGEVAKRMQNTSLTFIVGRKRPLEELRKDLPKLEIIMCRPGFYIRDKVCLAQACLNIK
ncbi:MAG: glycosyltransferase family 39 protein [Candidatus Desulfofervidaceae bacterium]|nr:glycosyltransferase family 39 protein [Candidatus Desulfofervidaceae bacterium]